MNPFYCIVLYHDTDTQCSIAVHDNELSLEHFGRRLYNQLRAMGAKGEIRFIRCHRGPTKMGEYQEEQVAFVNLNWYEFKYERTA